MNIRHNSKLNSFYNATEKLKKLGLKGEIALTSEIIMISCDTDKNNASLWRKALKIACKNQNVISCEKRIKNIGHIFTIKV